MEGAGTTYSQRNVPYTLGEETGGSLLNGEYSYLKRKTIFYSRQRPYVVNTFPTVFYTADDI